MALTTKSFPIVETKKDELECEVRINSEGKGYLYNPNKIRKLKVEEPVKEIKAEEPKKLKRGKKK